MKILLVVPMPPDLDAPGAIPRVLGALVEGLRRDHQVALVCVAGPEPEQLARVEELQAEGIDLYPVRRTEPRSRRERWNRRFRLASGWLGGRSPWRTVWFHDGGLQRELDRAVAGFDPDVIVVEDNALGRVRLPSDVPAVITEHEVRLPRPMRLPGPGRGLVRGLLAELDWRRWHGYQRRVWGRFDAIQVFTDRDALRLASVAPELADRVAVVPFGLVVPAALDASREEADRLVFVGNYTHAPNVDAAHWLAAEIMPRLRSLRPGASLRLIGDQPPASVRALDGPGVVVLGLVSNLASELERASVVVAPVRIGGGMRVKVVEAMALGKAVVTTTRGAQGLTVTDELVVADDADQIAAMAAQLLTDPIARRELGKRARRYVRDNHDPDHYAARVVEVYRRAAAARGGREISDAAAR